MLKKLNLTIKKPKTKNQKLKTRNQKPISILIYSLSSGGAERQVSLLLKQLSGKYEIFLVLMNDTIFYEIPDNVKIYYLEKSNPYESGLKKLLKLPFLAFKYARFCNKNNIKKSISFMTRPNYINILSKKFGNKAQILINERTTSSLQYKKGVKGLINRILIKNLYKLTNEVFTNSNGNKFDIEKNFGLKVSDVIYNMIDIKFINEVLRQKNYKTNFSKFTFITIGRLDEGKNHELLIDALKRGKLNANLLIIGDGYLRKKLELKIKDEKLEEKIKLLGRQKNPYKYLAKADCFIFSSKYEGFPNVILEALACGLPVISTDCRSGPREILAPDTDFRKQTKDIEFAKYGILVPVGDVNKMVEAMKIIVEDKKIRERYAKKAIERAKDFDIEKIIKQWEEILNVLF